ncbi:ABC transporter substrate-binding protein [Chelativorans sp. Marseille-P2723]|uniref:ABC transporter substrate-binding protein n=1 Tax=Chelativorans sp. Marseille-P2723 TaxID=2709133 RepID=UPI001FEDCB53|nr:ABC transporter substrate-binding protein [Chelativorans sp. Marseille-P2723]
MMTSCRKHASLFSGMALYAGATLVAPALLWPQPVLAGARPPARVMSLNLCTDQLAMALAAPGQLASISFLARDPTLSPLYRQAQNFPVNRGLAEEVFLAQPDLVVTGTYSLHNTTGLLRRLGFRVEEFSFIQTVETIPEEIRRMGKLLGHEAVAETLAASFEAELQQVAAHQCPYRPVALVYDQNGIALGRGTLADSVLSVAGFRNLAAEAGVEGMAPFPLELVVEKKPDLIITPSGYEDAPSLGDRVPHHAALQMLKDSRIGPFVPSSAWSCGGPAVIEAVKVLAELRDEIASCSEAQ